MPGRSDRQGLGGPKYRTLLHRDAGSKHRVDLEGDRRLADVVDPATRARMMRGIKGRDTQPELAVRRYLHATGLRYRLHDRRLPGSPDIVLPRFGTVVFVHGCFWHRHQGCRYATTPSSRTEFWSRKFTQNVWRDAGNISALQAAGWTVLTMWECQTRDSVLLDALFWQIVCGAPDR
jgi:DNA mismatch endonuclease, patch repair protein